MGRAGFIGIRCKYLHYIIVLNFTLFNILKSQIVYDSRYLPAKRGARAGGQIHLTTVTMQQCTDTSSLALANNLYVYNIQSVLGDENNLRDDYKRLHCAKLMGDT